MSKENLEQFMNQIAESEELQAKIGEEIDAEALIALGAECGCEFTAEELQKAARWGTGWRGECHTIVYLVRHVIRIFQFSTRVGCSSTPSHAIEMRNNFLL